MHMDLLKKKICSADASLAETWKLIQFKIHLLIDPSEKFETVHTHSACFHTCVFVANVEIQTHLILIQMKMTNFISMHTKKTKFDPMDFTFVGYLASLLMSFEKKNLSTAC